MDGDTDGRSQNSRMAKKVLCFFFLCLLKYTQFVIFHVFAARRRRRRERHSRRENASGHLVAKEQGSFAT